MDWSVILKNLTSYNTLQYLLNILTHYLYNRSIGYDFNNFKQLRPIGKGCPQGSCLGPILWNILINPIFSEFNKSFPSSSLLAFADDFAMISSVNTRRDLEVLTNNSINFFVNYCNTLKLKVSIQKTVAMTFGKDLKRRWPCFKIQSQSVKVVTEHKYLGVVLDNKLTFFKHLDYLRIQILQFKAKSHLVAFNYWGVKNTFLKIWYHSVVLSKILYGSPIFYNKLNCKGLTKLTSVNRIFLLKLSNAYRSTSNSALNVLTGIPPINDLITKFLIKFECKFFDKQISIQGRFLNKDDRFSLAQILL